MLTQPEYRLEGQFSEVRKGALKEKVVKGSDVLVFGHTHEAFVDEAQTIANTGSWLKPETTNPHYDTFLEISDGNVILKKWVRGEEEIISPRFSIPQLETLAKLW